MAIKFIPARRFKDPQERLKYMALGLLAGGARAVVEPETIGLAVLNQDDVIAIVGAIGTAPITGTLSNTAAETVAAAASVILADFAVMGSVLSTDTVVKCDQRDNDFLFTGYIETLPDGSGGEYSRLRVVAKNHTTASADVGAGQTIQYAVFGGEPQPQPRAPNAELEVVARFDWLDDEGVGIAPLTIENLNASALPIVNVEDASITEVELRSHDIGVLGSNYTGRRGILTIVGNKTVGIGATVLMGTFSFAGSTGPGIAVGQLGASPLFTGFVLSTNGVTLVSIYARNNTPFSLVVPTGTQLKVFAY